MESTMSVFFNKNSQYINTHVLMANKPMYIAKLLKFLYDVEEIHSNECGGKENAKLNES